MRVESEVWDREYGPDDERFREQLVNDDASPRRSQDALEINVALYRINVSRSGEVPDVESTTKVRR